MEKLQNGKMTVYGGEGKAEIKRYKYHSREDVLEMRKLFYTHKVELTNSSITVKHISAEWAKEKLDIAKAIVSELEKFIVEV